ncbi:MAG: TonB family protein, partial [Thermoanaerobaculia bacterium]
GGEVGGVVGGVEGGVKPTEPLPPDTILVARDERLPLKPLSMDYPMYPDKWRDRRVEDTLVLKYRIDKKGRVVDAIVLQHPRFKEFSDSALKAIRSWRFQPLTINGEPREIIHELTVNFRIEKPYERPPRAAKAPRADKPGEPPRPAVPVPGESPRPAAPVPGEPPKVAVPVPGQPLGPGRQDKRP